MHSGGRILLPKKSVQRLGLAAGDELKSSSPFDKVHTEADTEERASGTEDLAVGMP